MAASSKYKTSSSGLQLHSHPSMHTQPGTQVVACLELISLVQPSLSCIVLSIHLLVAHTDNEAGLDSAVLLPGVRVSLLWTCLSLKACCDLSMVLLELASTAPLSNRPCSPGHESHSF